MATIIDIDARTVNEIRAELMKYAGETLPTWTNVSDGDPASVFISTVAALGEVQYFYIDRLFNEAFLPTAQWKESLSKITERMGYKIAPTKSAKVNLRIYLASAAVSLIVIPKGSSFSTADGITFTTIEETSIAALETETFVDGFHGEITSNESLGTSTLSEYQRFKLANKPLSYYDNIYNVTVEAETIAGDGTYEEYDYVDNFLYSTSTDKHYTIVTDNEDDSWVEFGDGKRGFIPVSGAAIRATYGSGGGLEGNVPPTSVINVEGGNTDSLLVNNLAYAYGGEEPETLDQSRRYAPATARANDRIVSEEDYASASEEYQGVARATSFTINQVTYVIIVPFSDSGIAEEPTSDLKASLQKFLKSKSTSGAIVSVINPEYIEIGMTIKLAYKPNYLTSDVQKEVQSSVIAYLSPFRSDGAVFTNEFGKNVNVDEIYSIVRLVDGVSHAYITGINREGIDYDIDSTDGNIEIFQGQISNSEESIVLIEDLSLENDKGYYFDPKN